MSDVDWDKLKDELVEAIVAVLRPHVAEQSENDETAEDASDRAPSH